MTGLFNIINIPLSYVLKFFAELFGGNFAVAVFLFTLLINLVLIPLNIKSQKSMVQQTRIKPKLDELKKRYGDDRQKLAQAQQELYQQENISMSGGCLPLILRFVLMFSIYALILSPLTYLEGAQKAQYDNVYGAVNTAMDSMKKSDKDKYEDLTAELSWTRPTETNQLPIIRLVRDNPEKIHDILSDKKFKKIEKDWNALIECDKKSGLDYTLFGSERLNLTEKPNFSWNIFKDFQLLWLIPIAAFLAQMLTSVLSMMVQKKNNPDAPSMAGMMLTMPLISLFIGFTLPGGVGFYWICSSIIGGLVQVGVQVLYGPFRMLSKERAKELGKRCDFESKQLEKLAGTGNADQE